MRRRAKETPESDRPPLPLTHYRGSSNREAVAWIQARDDWWTEHGDPHDPGWLAWLLDSHEQVGVLSWCGSAGAPCGDDDCMCVVWPEHEAQTHQTNPSGSAHRATERNHHR